MQNFTVPQFIDVEDKIFGPITTRQFVIMLLGFMLMAILYKTCDFSLFITLSVIIFLITATFSFARINGRPFHLFALNLIQTFKKPSLRVWNHIESKTGLEETEEVVIIVKEEPIVYKKLNSSRLAELSLIVDTQGSYGGERNRDTKINAISNRQKNHDE